MSLKPGSAWWAPSKTVFTVSFLLYMATRFPTHTSKISTLLANKTSTWSQVHCRIKIQMPLHLLCCTEECNEYTGPSLSHIPPKNNTVGEMWQQRRPIQPTLDLNLKHPASQVAIANLLAVRTFGPCCLFCDSWWSGGWINCTFRSKCWCCRCSKEIWNIIPFA